jgi:hypothetical protein
MPRGVPVNPTKVIQCDECGQDMVVGTKTRTPKRCCECGIAASARAMQEMRSGSGDTFEKWLDGIARFAARNSQGTPLPH